MKIKKEKYIENSVSILKICSYLKKKGFKWIKYILKYRDLSSDKNIMISHKYSLIAYSGWTSTKFLK